MSGTEPQPAMPPGAERFGAWYDSVAAEMAVSFFPTYLRHTEAEWAGRPFRLSPYQASAVRQIFGWKRADGTRLYRRVYIEIPRKNGKTEFAAGLALLLLLADGEMGGQGYAMAVDKDQAKIAFNKATTMVEMSPALQRDVEAFKTSLYCPSLRASFKPLSRSPGSKHGFSPTFAIADEIHEWPSGELADVVRKGMAARRQPIEINLTTAGVYGRGYGWELHQYAERVRDGLVENPEFLAVIYGAQPEEDWTDEAVWARANPNLGVSPKIEFLRSELSMAQESPRLENDFKRFYLNLWTEQAERWLAMPAWDRGARPLDLAALAGRHCYAGLDLSSTTDLTALVLAFPDLTEDGEEAFDVLPFFFVPKDNIEKRAKRDKVDYPKWAKDGQLIATAGNVVDYGAIEDMLAELAEIYDIREIAFDRWNATQIVTNLTDAGFEMVKFGQGFASMSAPSKELEKLVLGGRIRHGGHPVLRFCAANVAVERDAADNIKPSKARSHDRIDGIAALVMALGRAIVAAPPPPDINAMIKRLGMLSVPA